MARTLLVAAFWSALRFKKSLDSVLIVLSNSSPVENGTISAVKRLPKFGCNQM